MYQFNLDKLFPITIYLSTGWLTFITFNQTLFSLYRRIPRFNKKWWELYTPCENDQTENDINDWLFYEHFTTITWYFSSTHNWLGRDAGVNFNSICFILAVSNSSGYCFKKFQRNVFPEICPLKAKRNTRDTFSKLNRFLIHRWFFKAVCSFARENCARDKILNDICLSPFRFSSRFDGKDYKRFVRNGSIA